jgi:hypothetical protein
LTSDRAREYARLFARLRTDKSRARWTETTNHRAPHKPLLSVPDLFDQSKVQSNLIQLTPELGETFNRYWVKVLALRSV